MASDDSRLESLITQCKANDVDVKVDALNKLQAEFEHGINDADGVIGVLKTTLRTSNQHLTTAAVSALPPLLPLLISHSQQGHAVQHQNPPSPTTSSTSSLPGSTSMDVFTLRQLVNAFLPPGGLIERLGDKEKIQLKARESLVVLGGLVFRSGGPQPSTRSSKAETPLIIFERFLRESGFGSKVWKVREQSIRTLVDIRKHHHLFPIRPYLTLLVAALEDTDAHVRDCARRSVIELFSGPGATDAARADLKKEMTKKGVRKTIVESVLSQLLGGAGSGSSAPQSREGSENGDHKPAYVPPSLSLQNRKPSGPAPIRTAPGTVRSTSLSSIRGGSRPPSRAGSELPSPALPINESADIAPAYVASSRDLEQEFAQMAKHFEGKENEHNWAARERAIVRVRGMLKGDVHTRYHDTFLACLKDGFIQCSLKTLASLRTTVAAHTCSMYSEMANSLGSQLDPFCDTLLTNLLKMACFTKKITAQQSQASVTTIINQTSAQPKIVIGLLWQYIQDKNAQARSYTTNHIKTYLEVHGQRSSHAIESHGGRDTLEKCIKRALTDPNPAVKGTARASFWVFNGIWPDRAQTLMATLDASSRTQLQKACPDPTLLGSITMPSTPTVTDRKNSVAAAIAASRAKAKVIATAPPTLRHQATSGSHATPVRRPSSPSHIPRPASRPSSPLRMSTTSPPSPPRAQLPSTVTASKSKSASPPHSRTTSSSSIRKSESPPQSTLHSRRLSSPLAYASGMTTTSPSKRASMIRNAIAAQAQSSPPDSRTSPTPRSRALGSNGHIGNARKLDIEEFTIPTKGGDDDSLLLAQAIPVPEDDDDSDMEDNLLSFSAPFEIAKAAAAASPRRPKSLAARSVSQVRSVSPKSNGSKPLSPGGPLNPTAEHPGDQSIVVEDALRATAEQAESAAERLLELVDPEDENSQHSTIPPSLLIGAASKDPAVSGTSNVPKTKPAPIGKDVDSAPPVFTPPPATPLNRGAAVMRQAGLFKNSPAYNKRSASLLDVLSDKKHETGWWLKRKNLIAQESPFQNADQSEKEANLQQFISALETGSADVAVLQKLYLLCAENPASASTPPLSPAYGGYPLSPSPSSSSAPSLVTDMWEQNKNFDRVFSGLMKFLDFTKSEEDIEYGLIVLWEMLNKQSSLIEGREAEIFTCLFQVRYSNRANVLEATNTIRDSLTSQIEPVYGLTTLHGSLKAFHAEKPPPGPPVSPADLENIKTQTYAFGLLALGKFILRLPLEILEEELPRLRSTLISALNETSVVGGLVVREAAAAAIIAAQLVLRDEGHLFVLLDGLRDDKKNLLTYLFDKHGARGNGGMLNGQNEDVGIERLQREMRRLDTRTSTPPRPSNTQ